MAGTTNLVSVELIRNGKVIKKFEPKGYSLDFEYDDMTPLEKSTIKPADKRPPFVFYYLRAIQADGHMAWSSPIWVDVLPAIKKPPVVKKPEPVVATKNKSKLIVEEEEEEEFEEDDDLDDDL